MADNKSTIESKHFQVYIDPKCRGQGKQTYEEYFSAMSNSGIHLIYDKIEMNAIYLLSIEMPNSFSISKRQLTELQYLREPGFTYKDRDTLIICGGYNKKIKMATNACYEYSICTNEFTRLPDMITPRSKFVIFYQYNKIYVFGGDDTEHFENLLKNCEYFDYATKKWIRMADLNRCQCNGSVINYKDEFWLIGGSFNDNENYLIERYIKSKNLWEIVDINFGSDFNYSCFLLSPCENEILILYNYLGISTICKLNLMDHTLIVVQELANRGREPLQVIPVDENKMMVMYGNCYRGYGFILYDIKKGILFDHCPSSLYQYFPTKIFMGVYNVL